MRWIWRPPHRPFGLENRDDPIHAERRQDALRLHTFIVAGPACRAAHSDLHGQAEPGHGHVHRRLRVDAAQSGGTDHRPEHQEFARIVVPGDAAGRRYISNLVAFEVFTAAPVPEPATWVLLIAPLPILAFLASRRRTFASGQAPVRRRYVARE